MSDHNNKRRELIKRVVDEFMTKYDKDKSGDIDRSEFRELCKLTLIAYLTSSKLHGIIGQCNAKLAFDVFNTVTVLLIKFS